MADQRATDNNAGDISDLIQEELERVRQREKEIQDEVYRERFEGRKQSDPSFKNDHEGIRSIRSTDRDSSYGSGSYDIERELREEREGKRRIAEELEIREKQIQMTTELLERQSKMLASFEANVMGQNQNSVFNQMMSSYPAPAVGVYHQSVHTNYQYQQYPAVDTMTSSYYQYNQQNTSNLYQYPNSTIGTDSQLYQHYPSVTTPLAPVSERVTDIVVEPAAKKAKTETGVTITENVVNDLKRKNVVLQCTYRRCMKTGHDLAHCNLLASHSKNATCYYCNTPGHRKQQCPKLVNKNKEKVYTKKDIVCYNCNTVGHHFKDCPAKDNKSISGALYICFKCGKPGHVSKDCSEGRENFEINGLSNITVTTSNIMIPNRTSNEKNTTKSKTKLNSNLVSVKKNRGISVGNGASSSVSTVTSNLSGNSSTKISTIVTETVKTNSVIPNNPSTVLSSVSNNATSSPIVRLPEKFDTSTDSVHAVNNTPKSFTVESDIAAEMEKFKQNPKHMMSLAKYRRHIINLRKSQRENSKVTVPTQATVPVQFSVPSQAQATVPAQPATVPPPATVPSPASEENRDSPSKKVPQKQQNIISSQNPKSDSTLAHANSLSQNPKKEIVQKEGTSKSVDIACEVCQFTSNLQSEINTHKLSPQHIKKCELCQTGCKMCGKIKFKTFTEYTTHKSDRLHQALVCKKGQISSSRLAKIAKKVAGVEYVVPVSGYFCKLCKKFYNKEAYAKGDHCRSKEHHDKIGEVVSAKYESAIRAKVLELYKEVVKENTDVKKIPVKLLEAVSVTDFTNLKPLANTKSPARTKSKSKELSKTVTKALGLSSDESKELSDTKVVKDCGKQVTIERSCDISEATDTISNISDQFCSNTNLERLTDSKKQIAMDMSSNISKTSDVSITGSATSVSGSWNPLEVSEVKSENRCELELKFSNQLPKDVEKELTVKLETSDNKSDKTVLNSNIILTVKSEIMDIHPDKASNEVTKDLDGKAEGMKTEISFECSPYSNSVKTEGRNSDTQATVKLEMSDACEIGNNFAESVAVQPEMQKVDDDKHVPAILSDKQNADQTADQDGSQRTSLDIDCDVDPWNEASSDMKKDIEVHLNTTKSVKRSSVGTRNVFDVQLFQESFQGTKSDFNGTKDAKDVSESPSMDTDCDCDAEPLMEVSLNVGQDIGVDLSTNFEREQEAKSDKPSEKDCNDDPLKASTNQLLDPSATKFPEVDTYTDKLRIKHQDSKIYPDGTKGHSEEADIDAKDATEISSLDTGDKVDTDNKAVVKDENKEKTFLKSHYSSKGEDIRKMKEEEDSSDTVVYDVEDVEQMEAEDDPEKMNIDAESKIDIEYPQENFEIKHFNPQKSLNESSLSSLLYISDIPKAVAFETGGSNIGKTESPSAVPITNVSPEKLQENPTVPTEKMESTDDTDLLLSDDEMNLSGDCDFEIDLSD